MTACVSRTRSATSHIGPGPPRGWAAIGDGSARAAPGTRHGRRQHGSGARFGSRPPCRIELPGSRSRERRQERCGRSAVGSASPCQGEGRGFESRRPLGRGPGNKHLRILRRWDGREARQRPAKPCTRVRIPFPPLSVPPTARAISSAGERFPDTEEVTGPIPVSPTIALTSGNADCRGRASGHGQSESAACLTNCLTTHPSAHRWPRPRRGHPWRSLRSG